tara:strand:- start:3199 stop:3438 length:240 start_codon:yes stop_codon:yes gene_type:complete
VLLVKERVDARDEDDGEERCDEDKNVIASFSLSLSLSYSYSLARSLAPFNRGRKGTRFFVKTIIDRQFFRWRVFVKSRE